MCALQLSIVGKSDLEALIRQIETDAASGGAISLEVLIVYTAGKESVVANGILGARDGRAAQHSACTSSGRQGAEAGGEGTRLKVADPDGREAVVIRIEWNQEGATDDGDVRRQGVITLEIGQGDKVGVVVTSLVTTFGREGLQQYGATLDEQARADGGSEQWLEQGLIARLTRVGRREEAYPAGEQRRILSGTIPQCREHGETGDEPN